MELSVQPSTSQPGETECTHDSSDTNNKMVSILKRQDSGEATLIAHEVLGFHDSYTKLPPSETPGAANTNISEKTAKKVSVLHIPQVQDSACAKTPTDKHFLLLPGPGHAFQITGSMADCLDNEMAQDPANKKAVDASSIIKIISKSDSTKSPRHVLRKIVYISKPDKKSSIKKSVVKKSLIVKQSQQSDEKQRLEETTMTSMPCDSDTESASDVDPVKKSSRIRRAPKVFEQYSASQKKCQQLKEKRCQAKPPTEEGGPSVFHSQDRLSIVPYLTGFSRKHYLGPMYEGSKLNVNYILKKMFMFMERESRNGPRRMSTPFHRLAEATNMTERALRARLTENTRLDMSEFIKEIHNDRNVVPDPQPDPDPPPDKVKKDRKVVPSKLGNPRAQEFLLRTLEHLQTTKQSMSIGVLQQRILDAGVVQGPISKSTVKRALSKLGYRYCGCGAFKQYKKFKPQRKKKETTAIIETS